MRLRVLLLPLLAVLAVVAVLAVQLLSGGNDYTPPPPAAACVERQLPAATAELEKIAEGLVLLGVQRAACDLGVSRERLLLSLPSAVGRASLAAQAGRPEPQVTAALRQGLKDSVTDLERGNRLPRASALLDSYGDQLGLPGFAEAALRRVPDQVIDGLLPTPDVLRRTIDNLDVPQLLDGIGAPGGLEGQLRTAIRDAAIAEARARISDQLSRLLP